MTILRPRFLLTRDQKTSAIGLSPKHQNRASGPHYIQGPISFHAGHSLKTYYVLTLRVTRFTRWYNLNSADLRRIVEEYEQEALPLDVMVLDMNCFFFSDKI